MARWYRTRCSNVTLPGATPECAVGPADMAKTIAVVRLKTFRAAGEESITRGQPRDYPRGMAIIGAYLIINGGNGQTSSPLPG